MREPEIVDRLREAAEAVESAGLPPDLRSAGFVLAFVSTGRDLPHAAQTDSSAAGKPKEAGGSLAALAKGLDVPERGLDRIYDLAPDRVSVIVPPRALPESRRAAMAEVTFLFVAARQALGFEEWTKSETVRGACEDRGVLDKNFGAVIGELDGHGIRVRGRGAQRELGINATGFERTIEIINRLLAELD